MSTRNGDRPRFDPDEFTDGGWLRTAEAKARFANALAQFIASGWQEAAFSDVAYRGLRADTLFDFCDQLHLTRIAVYRYLFEARVHRIDFLDSMLSRVHKRHRLHRDGWAQDDLASALAERSDWFTAARARETALHTAETEAAERAHLRALLEKYGDVAGGRPAPQPPAQHAPAGDRGHPRSPPAAESGRLFDPELATPPVRSPPSGLGLP